MTKRHARAACLLVAAALLGLPSAAGAKAYKKDFEAKALRRAEVKLRHADIKVLAHDAARVEVRSSARELCAELRGDVLHIDDEQVPKNEHVELSLRLPRALALKIKLVSGDVKVEGVKGRVDVKSVSGDVEVRAAGPVKLKAVSGDIKVVGAEGTLKAQTVSGSVKLEEIAGDRLKLKSHSGDLRVEQAAFEDVELKTFSGDARFFGRLAAGGELEAEAFSGSVSLGLPGEPGYDLEVSSKSGEVEVGEDLQVYEKSEHHARGKVGAGQVEVRVKTFSGDVRVETTK